MSELAGRHPPAPIMRSPTIGQDGRAKSQVRGLSSETNIKLPAALQALGDEISALRDYLAHGLLTPEEAQERIDHWEIYYPPGWSDIADLVHVRRHAPISLEAGV